MQQVTVILKAKKHVNEGVAGVAVLAGSPAAGSVGWGYIYVRGVARCLIHHGVGEACGGEERLNEASTTFKEESDKAGKKGANHSNTKHFGPAHLRSNV